MSDPTIVMSAVQADDVILDALGSASPPVFPSEWELECLLLQWREAVESRPFHVLEVA